MHDYGVPLVNWEALPTATAMVAAVAHAQFQNRPLSHYFSKLAPHAVLIDVKGQLDAARFKQQGLGVWRL